MTSAYQVAWWRALGAGLALVLAHRHGAAESTSPVSMGVCLRMSVSTAGGRIRGCDTRRRGAAVSLARSTCVECPIS